MVIARNGIISNTKPICLTRYYLQ